MWRRFRFRRGKTRRRAFPPPRWLPPPLWFRWQHHRWPYMQQPPIPHVLPPLIQPPAFQIPKEGTSEERMRESEEEKPTEVERREEVKLEKEAKEMPKVQVSTEENSKKMGLLRRILEGRRLKKRFYTLLEQRILELAYRYGNVISPGRILVDIGEIDGKLVTSDDINLVLKKLVKRGYLKKIGDNLYVSPGLELSTKELEVVRLFYEMGGRLTPTDIMIRLPHMFKTVDEAIAILKKLKSKGIVIEGKYEEGMMYHMPAAEIRFPSKPTND
ncbi:MAG: hypothetical protein ACTSXJ_10825 [Candidatus Baldrarchaeia archaeon]